MSAWKASARERPVQAEIPPAGGSLRDSRLPVHLCLTLRSNVCGTGLTSEETVASAASGRRVLLGGLAHTPAPFLVVGSAFSVQSSAAVATALFDEAGPLGAVWLRTAFAVVIVILLVPTVGRRGASGPFRWILALGLTLAAMNSFFYESIARVPLGVAVTVEFLGPLAVALAGSRRARDLLWVVLAGAGIALLGSPTVDVDRTGLLLAFGAAACWAASIVVSKRVVTEWPLAESLTLPLAISTLALMPVGLTSAGSALADPSVLALGVAVATLGTVVPNLLGLAALRRVRASTMGILLSLNPAVAAFAGFVFLAQGLEPAELLAVGLVVVASAGANWDFRGSAITRARSHGDRVRPPPEPPA
jgi:inner membrane transporter RhtA